MVKIADIDIFLNVLNELSANNSYYQLYGTTKEYANFQFRTDEKPTKYSVDIVALTAIGTLYFTQSVNLSDEDEAFSLKKKVSTLKINEVKQVDAQSNHLTIS